MVVSKFSHFILNTRHIFSEAKQTLRRHPGNYLSTRLCLVKRQVIVRDLFTDVKDLWTPVCAGVTAVVSCKNLSSAEHHLKILSFRFKSCEEREFSVSS